MPAPTAHPPQQPASAGVGVVVIAVATVAAAANATSVFFINISLSIGDCRALERRRLPSAVLPCCDEWPRTERSPEVQPSRILPVNLSEFGQSCDGARTVCSQKRPALSESECARPGWRFV